MLIQVHDPTDQVWRQLEEVLESGDEAVLATALSDPVVGRRILITAIARVVIPKRPGRRFPRAVKIKMSNYPLKRRRHVG